MANCSRPRPSRNRPLAAESLENRLSPSSIPVHGVIVPLPENTFQVVAMNDLGGDPPITRPELPPLGPVGSGSSS